MICIKTFANPFDAEVARRTLEAHGLAVRLSSDDGGDMVPSGFGGVQLFVEDADAERAVTILTAPEAGAAASADQDDPLGARLAAPIDVRVTAPAHDWKLRSSIKHAAEEASGLLVEINLTRTRLGNLLSFLSDDESHEGMYGLRTVQYVIMTESGDPTDLVQTDRPNDAVWYFRDDHIASLCAALSKLVEMLADYVGDEIFVEVCEVADLDDVAQFEVNIPIAQLVSDIRGGQLRKRARYRVQVGGA